MRFHLMSNHNPLMEINKEITVIRILNKDNSKKDHIIMKKKKSEIENLTDKKEKKKTTFLIMMMILNIHVKIEAMEKKVTNLNQKDKKEVIKRDSKILTMKKMITGLKIDMGPNIDQISIRIITTIMEERVTDLDPDPHILDPQICLVHSEATGLDTLTSLMNLGILLKETKDNLQTASIIWNLWLVKDLETFGISEFNLI